MPTPTGVSDAAYLCQQQERPVHDSRLERTYGHNSIRYDVAEAIKTLIDYGFTVGCDGELLPPRWVRVLK